ncbi:MAG: DUF624 domain-containing protein [Thermoflexaceae bacterium]|nr:DUF624 domain-containing protein [Thermoflexaceae bacterium]
MNRLFDLDNGFFRFMGKICDMILLDVLTLIMCIPIVTIGPALTALYYVSLKIVRDEEGYVFKSYFKSFKQNFKQGFLLELIVAACAAILYVDLGVTYNWMSQNQNYLLKLLFFALVGFALIAIVTVVYVFPILAKFENSTKRILINSVMMAVKHLPYSVLMVIITVLAGVLTYIYPIAIFFVVGGAAFLNSIILRKIFDNYIKVDSQGKVITENVQESEESKN